jgi:hypothetical protein
MPFFIPNFKVFIQNNDVFLIYSPLLSHQTSGLLPLSSLLPMTTAFLGLLNLFPPPSILFLSLFAVVNTPLSSKKSSSKSKKSSSKSKKSSSKSKKPTLNSTFSTFKSKKMSLESKKSPLKSRKLNLNARKWLFDKMYLFALLHFLGPLSIKVLFIKKIASHFINFRFGYSVRLLVNAI